MKSHTRVAVIGGGLLGCSTLYHLTRMGWTDVVLIEKAELTAGSTWHAAGMVPGFAECSLIARILHESQETYKNLETLTGSPSGVHECGSIRLANNRDEEDENKRFLGIARQVGRWRSEPAAAGARRALPRPAWRPARATGHERSADPDLDRRCCYRK